MIRIIRVAFFLFCMKYYMCTCIYWIIISNAKCILIHKRRNNKNINSLQLKYSLVFRKEQKKSYKMIFKIKNNLIFKKFLLYLFFYVSCKNRKVYISLYEYICPRYLSNSQSVKTISTLKHLVSDRVALPTIGDGYHFRFQIGIVSTFQKFK